MLDANFWQDKNNSKLIIKEKKLFEELINSQSNSIKKLNDLEVRWTKGIFYKTVISDLSDLKNVYYDILVFFSPSGIESLLSNFPDFKQNDTRIAVFGKNTASAAENAGLRIDIQAPLNKIPSMSRALYVYIEKANKKR